HHVVPIPLLILRDGREVDVVEMPAHLRDRLRRNVDAELAFRLGERQPQATPVPIARGRRPELEHRPGRVPLGERRGIALVVGHRRAKSTNARRRCRSRYMRTYPRPEYACRARLTSSA